jgi:plasmid stabilization system protein ParE
MSCTVVVLREAEAQPRAADGGWPENRPAAAVRPAGEFARVVDLLGRVPDIGQRFARAAVPGVRRVLLPKSRCYVYYLHDRRHHVVYVLALWGAARGETPPLPPSFRP